MLSEPKVKLLVFSGSTDGFEKLARALEVALSGFGDFEVIQVEKPSDISEGAVVLVELSDDGQRFAQEIQTKQIHCLLAVAENLEENLDALMKADWADGWWLWPFQGVALIGALRAGTLLRRARSLSQGVVLDETILGLKGDLEMASQFQRERFQSRLEDIGGFKLKSRYLAGARAGGNYFEAVESEDGKTLHLLVTDSSSYGLSSQILGLVFRMTSQLSRKYQTTPRGLLSAFRNEILAAMRPTDQLSVFIASLSRRDLKLRYLHLGLGQVRYIDETQSGWQELAKAVSPPLSRSCFEVPEQEGELQLSPGGRLVILSPGFSEQLGSGDWDERVKKSDPKDLLTELTYRVRSHCSRQSQELPERDCTAIILDLDKKMMRLAS